MALGVARARTEATASDTKAVSLLLDTHFLIWIITGSRRLAEFPWIYHHEPWGASPISLLEIQFLAEVGKLEVQNPDFSEAILSDRRFVFDDPSLRVLVRNSLSLTWTRDPFDRLLCAHSLSRRMPFCTTDDLIRKYHPLLPEELQPKRS